MITTQPDWDALTRDADRLLRTLFPICRSITGHGTRSTLNELRQVADFHLHEVASGSACYDWTVPDEWNVRDAYVADAHGRRVIDFQSNNVHLVNNSIPFRGKLGFDELAPHLHTLPDLPNAIPYRTTYYDRAWGFCLSEDQFQKLDKKATYEVVVDTTLEPGSLTYGEALLPGTSGDEYLVSTYVCHPSLANDNLSGVVLWTLLLREMQKRSHRHSYRFVIAPETIGALVYIARNEAVVRALKGGFIATTVAGPGPFGYKASWCGDALVDRATRLTFCEQGLEFIEYPFDINGSDERQYSSPGLRVPVGTICKDKYYEYPYYHTSLDNLDFIRPEALVETLKITMLTIEKLELDHTYRSLNPIGEPMLGRRGLYPKLGGSLHQKTSRENVRVTELDAMRWVLFHSDGKTSLLTIAEMTGVPMDLLAKEARVLVEAGLLELVT